MMIMSKLRKLVSIAAIFPIGLTPIYGYARDATRYGMENHIIVVQPPVVLKSLGDNQFCTSSTISNPDLVPYIFTETDKSHEKDIDITDMSSIWTLLCTTEKEEKEIVQEVIQYVNTALVDSEMYSNQKRINFLDRIRGLVNSNIKSKMGLFHFQVPSFTLTADEEMVTSMEIAIIEEVQREIYRVFSNSNEERSLKLSYKDRIKDFLNTTAEDFLTKHEDKIVFIILVGFTVGFLGLLYNESVMHSKQKSNLLSKFLLAFMVMWAPHPDVVGNSSALRYP